VGSPVRVSDRRSLCPGAPEGWRSVLGYERARRSEPAGSWETGLSACRTQEMQWAAEVLFPSFRLAGEGPRETYMRIVEAHAG
jgi:hypothetical protein